MTKEALAALEEPSNRSHRSGCIRFGGACLCGSLILLKAPQRGRVGSFTLWRRPGREGGSGPDVRQPAFVDRFSRQDGRFPCPGEVAREATEKLCRDYWPVRRQAADRPASSSRQPLRCLSSTKKQRGAEASSAGGPRPGRAECLKQIDQPWAEALEQAALRALAYHRQLTTLVTTVAPSSPPDRRG
jgi:hypothetical protein